MIIEKAVIEILVTWHR